MKKLQASNNKTKYALVDDDVFETIKEMNLKFSIQPNGYFRSTAEVKFPGMMKKKRLLLHQLVWILKTGEEPSSEVDHADIDKLNNQFSNLRLATRKEQQHNQRKRKDNTSGYIGVSREHRINKYKNKKYENDYWRTSIRRPDGKHEQKCFKYTNEGLLEAVRWRDQKAIEYYKEFAVTNFPDENK